MQGPIASARSFGLTEYWKHACEKLPPAPSSFTAAQWKGQNACWGWMKKLGCYEVAGDLSWRNAQIRTAKQGYAPFPEVIAMEPLQNPGLCDRPDLGMLNDTRAEEVEAAKTWLNENVGVYVLNLLKDTGRWASISMRLAQLGVEFQRIPGVDLSGAGAIDTSKRAGLVPWNFNFTLAQLNADSKSEGMGGILGTVGCAAAHLNAMKTVILEQDHPPNGHRKPLALILEDDVMVMNDFAVKLRRLLETEAPCDWDVISLRTRCPYGECVAPHLTRVFPDGNEPAERCRHGVNYGFFAMLYRLNTLDSLRSKLSRVVWDTNRPHCLDVDVALASISDEVAYYAVPHLQKPGFLFESGHDSVRWKLNQDRAIGTSTAPIASTHAFKTELVHTSKNPFVTKNIGETNANATMITSIITITTTSMETTTTNTMTTTATNTATTTLNAAGVEIVTAPTTTRTRSNVLISAVQDVLIHNLTSQYNNQRMYHHPSHDLQVPWQVPTV